jgi:hypothetical protein
VIQAKVNVHWWISQNIVALLDKNAIRHSIDKIEKNNQTKKNPQP